MKKFRFYSLNTILCLSTLFFSGCRFGNHSESPQPLKNADTYKSTELFFTDPHQLETRVYLNSLSGPSSVKHENLNAPFSAIPEFISKYFTSIVYFAIPVDPSANPSIVSLNGLKFYTQIDSSGNPSYSAPQPRPVSVLWENQNCGISYNMTHEGSFDHSEAGNYQIDGQNIYIAGSLTFNYGYSINIQSYGGTDNCTADLTYLANCYNGTGCPANTVQYAKEIFDVPVRAGVLNITDAAQLKAVEYIIHYQ